MSDSEDQANGGEYDDGDDHSVEDDGIDELFGDDGESPADDQQAEYVHRESLSQPNSRQITCEEIN